MPKISALIKTDINIIIIIKTIKNDQSVIVTNTIRKCEADLPQITITNTHYV